GAFFNRRVRMFRDLQLDEPSLTPVDPSLVADRLAEVLARKWDWVVSQSPALAAWMHRWNFLVEHASDRFSVLDSEVILKTVSMAAFGKTKIAEVLATDLVSLLEMSLDKGVLRMMAAEVPASFAAPSGVSHQIHYDEKHSAYVEVRLQEIFGLLASPRLVFGKLPLTFRLLGPNYRPVQVTSDLASFWKSGYLEVRKELRLKYPKHSWPEDPYSATPEAKGRRRT
ncbi:MAG: ATP-dependent helicase C-terminal domain-containing protein, partial [Bdellovibrionales bacterium]